LSTCIGGPGLTLKGQGPWRGRDVLLIPGCTGASASSLHQPHDPGAADIGTYLLPATWWSSRPVKGAGIHLASFDLDALRAYRRAETMGNAFRRPAAYRSLTDAHIAGILVRVDRYGRPPRV
jgi:hypothetical protein